MQCSQHFLIKRCVQDCNRVNWTYIRTFALREEMLSCFGRTWMNYDSTECTRRHWNRIIRGSSQPQIDLIGCYEVNEMPFVHGMRSFHLFRVITALDHRLGEKLNELVHCGWVRLWNQCDMNCYPPSPSTLVRVHLVVWSTDLCKTQPVLVALVVLTRKTHPSSNDLNLLVQEVFIKHCPKPIVSIRPCIRLLPIVSNPTIQRPHQKTYRLVPSVHWRLSSHLNLAFGQGCPTEGCRLFTGGELANRLSIIGRWLHWSTESCRWKSLFRKQLL